MKNSKEQIWRQYKRATRLQYICTLIVLHRAFGFGKKRLGEFEDIFTDVVAVVSGYANDDVINEKLSAEVSEMGYSLPDLLSDGTDLTFSEMHRRDKIKEKQTLAECAEVANKLRATWFYGEGETDVQRKRNHRDRALAVRTQATMHYRVL